LGEAAISTLRKKACKGSAHHEKWWINDISNLGASGQV
jgi:hypothetical protein